MELGALGQFGFLTLPNYSLIACANAIEALRMANRVSARTAYKWRLLTADGAPARASNGMSLQPTAPLNGARAFDIVFVCGGLDIRRSTGRLVLAALRRLAREHVPLGALCTGRGRSAFGLPLPHPLGEPQCDPRRIPRHPVPR